jgi:hypothetical protein
MRIIAPMMILIMMTSTLAGCTGGDPDSGGNDNIDMDVINSLIDDNLQDFINNTTITVENHYHNNTTIVNDDNSISNINGSDSTSTIKMFTVEWDKIEYMLMSEETLTPGEKMVTLTGTNSSSGGGDNTLLFTYGYNGYALEFRLTCNEYMHYYTYWDRDNWEDWLVAEYGYLSGNGGTYDTAYGIDDDIYDNWRYGFDAEEQCSFSGSKYTELITLFEINLEEGEAISFLSKDPYVTVDINCEDGYGTGIGNGTSVSFMGGQADCVISGSTTVKYGASSISSDIFDNYANRYIYETVYLASTHTYDYQVQSSFSVYFTSHVVEVYENEI